ncbi:MAG: glycosyltransferase [Flavobacteria bacterium RIFCSPLOWO2_12_FULL_35_11]|nr:MAG: glycosyltransferase [Flavobacteria bacterium RIFCSPLOWO2_12_FULL_35_11]
MFFSNSKLKIAVLGTRGFPNVQGGVEVHCENLYPQLVTLGCEVIVITRKPYINTDIDTYKGVKLLPLFCLKNKFLETFLHTFMGVFVARRLSPDILHIHAIGPSLFIPLARLLGLKVVMTNHGPDYQRKKWGKLAKVILKLGESLGSKWADGIICISESIADSIRKKYNRVVTVIPNGVTIPIILQSEDTLKKYRLEKGKYILAVGRFVQEKGFHDLIEAFKQIQNSDFQSKIQNPKSKISIDHWKLVIVGRADHEDKYSLGLKEKTRENNNIVLTGFLTGQPLQELYSHAGLFVLPSYYEGLPIVLLEAMGSGLSCIASDIPANRNVELSDERFFKAGDVKALALKIKEFVNKPLSEEDRKKQIRMISERYDWEKIAEKTLEVYGKVLSS